MKRRLTLLTNLLLVFVLLFGSICTVSAQTETDEYIPVHTSEELSTFFRTIITYLGEDGDELLSRLDDAEEQIVSTAMIRAWGITVYEDATPQQIDDAYDALYNMSLFLGLAADPQSSFTTGALFQYASDLLDQEYYDLLEAAGESQDVIDEVVYLRDIAEALVDDPESFTAEEVEEWLLEIYAESYLASGLKAIAHTEALPDPQDLFPDTEESTMMPNPEVMYETQDPLDEMLGIRMPGLPDDVEATLGYYSIIAEFLAESKYDLPDDGIVVLRLAKATEEDISGVYGASFYEDWEIASTMVEVNRYQTMYIAVGTVKTLDEAEYSFAVDAEGVSEELFRQIVTFFIESCRNQRSS